MADSEVLKRLKDIPYKIQTASMKGRREVVKEICEVLETPGISEQAVRFVCRVLPLTLHRYRDNRSQALMRAVVGHLALTHRDATLNSLTPVLQEIAEHLINIASTKSTSQSGLHVLRWSTVLVENSLKATDEDGVEYEALVLTQARLLASVTAYGDNRRNDKAYTVLHRQWNILGKQKQAKWVEVLVSQAPDSGPHLCTMFAALCRHLSDTGDVDAITQHKAKMLESFTKSLISVKSRPNSNYIKGCAALLRLLNTSDVQDTLLPALQKAMLRSPETIIQAVGEVFDNLEVKIEGIAVEIGKSLIVNCHSRDSWTREAAAGALGRLAARLLPKGAIDLLTHAFKVQGGLTSSEDKIAVLNAIGILSTVGGTEAERKTIWSAVCLGIGRVLESESHERTLCLALDVLQRWLCTLPPAPPIPSEIIDLFKKNMSAKSTTQAVRGAYTRVVSRGACRCGAAPSQRDVLLPLFNKAVDKAIAQPLQPGVVSEGLAAMLGLVVVWAPGEGEGSPAWTALTHPARHTLLQDRTLSAQPDDVLVQVVYLCRTVLEKYSSVASEVDSPIYRAFILVLLSPVKVVRTTAIEEVKALLAKRDRAHIAKNLVTKLNEVLEEGKVFGGKEKSPSEEKGTEVTGKMILDCVHALCSYTEYSVEDAEALALETLVSCHQSGVEGSENGRAWRRVLSHLRLQAPALVARHSAALAARFVAGYRPAPAPHRVLRTLSSADSGLASAALSSALDRLRPPLTIVSRDDYFVYLTPEGELYDKSALPGNEDNKEMNMKRESKVYSYKEQLEELQLRRELEEKRKKEGKVKEVPLTAKQKEAIKAQLAKESEIRERLRVVAEEVSICMELVEAACGGSPAAGRGAARRLLPALLGAARSPLHAPPLLRLYPQLAAALVPPHHRALAAAVARVTLRLNEPACDLDPEWIEEPVECAAKRTVLQLHAATVARRKLQDGASNHLEHFTAPGFCYIFQLLKKALSPGLSDEATMVAGLAVIGLHARLRPAGAGPEADLLHPAYFPIDDMFRLLIDLISKTRGRAQTASTAALLDTAECAAQASVTQQDVDCLLAGLQDPLEAVRDAALRALICLKERLEPLFDDPEFALTLTKRLMVATFDESEDNRKLAGDVWEAVPARPKDDEALLEALLGEVSHPSEPVQKAAAEALAAAASAGGPSAAELVVQRLHSLYEEKLPLIPARVDSFGHQIAGEVDEWGARRGVALALRALAPQLAPENVPDAVRFFVQRALADRQAAVRADMLDAAMAVVELHGKATVGSQLPVFEEFLDRTPKSGGFDAVRQSVVLLVGSLARHLAPADARVRPITLRLVAALSTPSQQVQEAVSNCLPHLVTSPALEPDIPTIVNKLMKQLLTAEKYGDRKGAAYGIAGIIKGLGILSLKQLDVMGKLTEAIQDKKNYKCREGALFGFEMLCAKLGRLFEPYVVHVLPHLLVCFGDGSQYVRAAADDAAKLIMSRLSAHGVKLVLPALLHALTDDNWRTKAGSIELLGSMAFCAPKQLSSCLPSIVPKLIEVLGDSHLRVQRAGVEALGVIGSVIRNPEIQAIVPVLLEALRDPAANTSACLQTLLDTKFVHFIDAPSLALIMPVVERAFLDRSTDTRKMAAQIIGNMYSLTDQKDLTPYLPSIIPGLKASLLDPVPEVRSVSARALGAMVRGLGEPSFEELLPWLMHTLTSETSSVDRSGAAQGLAEVVAGLGSTKLRKIMPDIIATAERQDIAPHVKDGYIMMFIYMPGCFTDEFTPYIGQIINPILKALADENEYVRETALKAGQRIVTLYAESAIALLLPELERGLFDDNWRIRYSSVQLLGDLLYRISGVSGKMSTETASEDDNFGTEHSHRAIMDALGPERRNRVLAGLYMGRSDVALMVRQAALHVWKVVVTNTPKTLREILPTLFGLLLGCLASTSYDKRQVAARTLGDLVRKLGERVLPEIVPILERGLKSDRADQRQGVCIGLGEILNSTSRDAVLSFADGLVPTVRTALCDPLPEVRQAAARTFDALHATVGNKALDDILPAMLAKLREGDAQEAEAALDGLKQIMAIKSRAVLPYLVPVLTGQGGAGVDTRALSALAAAAGGALGRHLPRVLPALLTALEAAQAAPPPQQQRELEHCRDALLPINEPASVRVVVDALLEAARGSQPDAGRRRAAARLLCAYVSHTRADLAPHVPQLLRGLLLLLNETDQDVLLMAWEALQVFIKSLEPEQLISHVSDVRQAIRHVAADLKGELLPGFCLPKGIAPILPLFRESILNGLPEEKENAALMLGEVIKLTSAAALQPSVVHVTGPLIRILGDRFNASVKAAVLDTLAALLAKVGAMLKQFLPQLQTTFLKALGDANRAVRLRAGTALARLVLIHTRADPLFVEMHNGVRAADEQAVRETCLQALRLVLVAGGGKMSGPLALQLLATLSAPALLAHQDDALRGAAAGCLGALLHCLPPPHADAALLHHVLPEEDGPLLAGRTAALFVALKETPDAVYRDGFRDKVEKSLLSALGNEKPLVAGHAVRGLGYLIRHEAAAGRAPPPAALAALARALNHPSNEVKQLVARAAALAARDVAPAGAGAEVLRVLLPALVNGTKEKNSYVRANSELALRTVLHLPHDEEYAQKCMSVLESGAREALADVVARVLRRAHTDTRDEDLDCTLLT